MWSLYIIMSYQEWIQNIDIDYKKNNEKSYAWGSAKAKNS